MTEASAKDRVSSLTDIPPVAAYLDRIGAKPRSLTTAVVIERDGNYPRDRATVRFDKATGEITVNAIDAAELEPTDAERADIATAIKAARWPELKRLHRLVNLPAMIAEADKDEVFEFRDASGQIVMVQVRRDVPDGKAYLPWTYWSDDSWRMCEPDGLLPLWGIPSLKDEGTAFIHEGAKAARFAQRLIEDTPEARKLRKEHPWGAQLFGAHVGWVGGALAAHRTDWSVLANAGITRVYIVNDNDDAGRRAVPRISRELARWNIEVVNISVTPDKFGEGWDLADPMPADCEPMMDYAVPATFVTRKVETGGRPKNVLRDVAAKGVVPLREQDCFAYILNGKVRDASQLDRELAPYSGVRRPSALFWSDNTHGSVAGLTYRPDTEARFVQEDGQRKFNTYGPPSIRGERGELAPWFDYLTYMFPNERDRREAERWIATLIGKPGTRLPYSMLLVSAKQGKGKSTLFDCVLRPLVGWRNSAVVSSKVLDSEFNGWAAGRRLVVCHEIYEAENWRLANKLKTIITEERITINEKFQRPFELPNWLTIAAASNDIRALAMSREDRRWLVPGVDEGEPWPKERFAAFRSWLTNGGLAAIMHWAENYPDHIRPGEHAPMTEAKRRAIEESRTPGAAAALAMAEVLAEWGEPGAVSLARLEEVARAAMPRCPDSRAALGKLAEEMGLVRLETVIGEERIKVKGRKERLLLNAAAVAGLHGIDAGDGEARRAAVRDAAEAWTRHYRNVEETM